MAEKDNLSLDRGVKTERSAQMLLKDFRHHNVPGVKLEVPESFLLLFEHVQRLNDKAAAV